jgi:hypothetical protein
MGLGHNFELHWPAGFLLDHGGTIAKGSTADQIANPNFDDFAATQFAVDGEIEQGTISQPLMLVEEKTDRPDVAGLQWSLWADILAGVPGAPFMPGRIKV